MDDPPVLWRGLGHADHSLLRPEADLLLQKVLQLFETEALVGTGVDPANAGLQLADLKVEPILFEEDVEVDGVDSTFVGAVDGPVERQRGEIRPPLHVVGHSLQVLEDPEFMLDDIRKCNFHLHWQSFESRNSKERSVAGLDPQIQILARQHDVHELLERQEASPVGVVEVDQLLTIRLRELHDVVVPQELQDVGAIQVFLGCAVDAHEGAVGAELQVTLADGLPQHLSRDLSFQHLDQDVSEQAFCMN